MWGVHKVLRPTSLGTHSSVARQQNVYKFTALKITYFETGIVIQPKNEIWFLYHLWLYCLKICHYFLDDPRTRMFAIVNTYFNNPCIRFCMSNVDHQVIKLLNKYIQLFSCLFHFHDYV